MDGWMDWDELYLFLMSSTIHINQPEFLENLMLGPFFGKPRDMVIAAVTSPKVSPVGEIK